MIKKIWNDPVWSKVISAVIIAIGTIVITTIFAKVNNTSFTEAWNRFWTFKIELWCLALVGIIIFLFLILIKRKSNKERKFLNYTQGIWSNTKWQWAWKYDPKTKKYHMFNLYTLCPKCQKGVFTAQSIYSREYNCVQCGFTMPTQFYNKPSYSQIVGEINKYISENYKAEMKYIDFDVDN